MSTTVSHSKTPPADARAAEYAESARMPTLPPAEDGGDEGKKDAGARTQTQRMIWKGYEAVARGEEVSFAHIDGGKGLDISEVISRRGTTQKSFPLPNGETFGDQLSIGLPKKCSNPRLLSMSTDTEGRGVWLEITGKNKGGVTTTTHILLTSKERVTGRDALVAKVTALERRIRGAYKEAKTQGHVSFTDSDGGKGLDISEVIAATGVMQKSFPLPNGETINAVLGIGLPEACSSPRLLSMSTDTEGRGVWLKITGKNEGGVTTTTHILLTFKEGVTGRDALVDYKVTKEDSPLVRRIREEYEQAKTKGHVSFTDIDGAKGLDVSEVITGYGLTKRSFPLPNGETIKAQVSIGLPAKCSNPRLLSMSTDTDGRGVWLEITGKNKSGVTKTTHILLSSKEGDTGPDALVCYGETREHALKNKENAASRAQTLEVICEGYEQVKTKGHVSFTNFDGGKGLDISEVIAATGTTRHSFPHPNGGAIQADLTIGLPGPCSNPRLLSMSTDEEGRGVWLEITGEKGGVTTTTHILLSSKEDVTEPDSLVCYGKTREHALKKKENAASRDRTRDIICEGYKQAKTQGHVSFTDIDDGLGLDISEVFGGYGRTPNSFPLPNGKTAQISLAIGLPTLCSNHRLLSMSTDAEGRGVWLEITAKNEGGVTTTTHILLTSKQDVTGHAALVCYGETREHALKNKENAGSRAQTQDIICKGYEQAKTKGHVSFTNFDGGKGLDISAVIAGNGTTKKSFPLPNGEAIKANLGIGLPGECSNPRLLSISYDQEQDLYSLYITAEKNGIPRETILVLKGEQGLTKRNAIHHSTGNLSDDLPLAFRQRIEKGRKCAQNLAIRASRKAGAAGSIAYTKGQCFEQLVGVLLAAQYPTERVIPQYCLKVDASTGYYGMRVDFKVGAKLFEVKWGNATKNIHKTHRDHTGAAGVDESLYKVITLCLNDELSVPYTLFSALAETHPLREELNDAMEKIMSLVLKGEKAGKQDKEERRKCVVNLEAVRDYLYDTFHRVGTNEASLLSGEQRIESLRSALHFLNNTPEEDLVRERDPKSFRHWTSLEAYWEIDGKVGRSLIPVHQLVEEEPQEYDLGFCYQREFYEEGETDYTFRPFATFRDIEDFKLLNILDDTRTGDERLCHIPGSITVTGEQDEHGWFVKPVFTISVGDTKLSLSRYPLGSDVTHITTHQELGNIAQKNGLTPPQDMSALDQIVDDATPYLRNNE